MAASTAAARPCISLAAEGYGPIALYVGGTGKAEFKDIAVGDLGLQVRHPEVTSADFRKQTINDFYYGWGQAAADFNHDGHLDIVSGPFLFYGPDFTKFREVFRGEATTPTNDFAMDAHEEFAQRLHRRRLARPHHSKFGGGPCVYLYVNPKGENRTWAKYPVVESVQSELTTVADIEGPGKPALVYSGDGYVRYAMPDPANPTGTWIIHNVSERAMARDTGLARVISTVTAGWISSILWMVGAACARKQSKQHGSITRVDFRARRAAEPSWRFTT